MRSTLLIIVILFSSFGLKAQEIIYSFLSKHGKDESIELTTIGRKMFAAMEEQSLIDDNLSNILSDLENINIISSTEQSLVDEYMLSAKALLEKNKEYVPVFHSEGEESILLSIRQDGESIQELTVMIGNPTSFNLINLVGNIEMENLINYAKVINFESLKDIIPQ